MDIDLTGRTALVTGSTAGIGLATAQGLAQQGATVWVTGRGQARVDAALATIGAACKGARLHGLAADLATAAGTETMIRAVPALDILVNNLGGVGARKPFDELDDADWLNVLELNLLSGVRTTRHYLRGMRAKDWGRVVFVSSESGLQIPRSFRITGWRRRR